MRLTFILNTFPYDKWLNQTIEAGAWLQANDGRQIHLRQATVPEDNGQHLALLVDDIKETYKMLTDAGITVTSPNPIGSSLQSFLHDPAGNRIEIHQCA